MESVQWRSSGVGWAPHCQGPGSGGVCLYHIDRGLDVEEIASALRVDHERPLAVPESGGGQGGTEQGAGGTAGGRREDGGQLK